MSSPSLARSVLSFLEILNEAWTDVHADDKAQRDAATMRIMRAAGALEVVAERRVDESELEAHRRVMEACHIELPVQVSRG